MSQRCVRALARAVQGWKGLTYEEYTSTHTVGLTHTVVRCSASGNCVAACQELFNREIVCHWLKSLTYLLMIRVDPWWRQDTDMCLVSYTSPSTAASPLWLLLSEWLPSVCRWNIQAPGNLSGGAVHLPLVQSVFNLILRETWCCLPRFGCNRSSVLQWSAYVVS